MQLFQQLNLLIQKNRIIMRLTIFCILVLVVIINIQAQSSLQGSLSDPYFECLKIHLAELKERNALADTVFVSQRDHLQDYTGMYGQTFIKMAPHEFIYERTKKRKSIWVILVNPIRFNKGETSITVLDFGVSRKKLHYTSVNNGGTKVKLSYNCALGRYDYEVIPSNH